MNKLLPLFLITHSGIAIANTSVIYPDQLSLSNLGAQVCATGNRAITKQEAEIYRNQIVNKMGKWQITSLANGWVIMGSGYSGEIKAGTAHSTWCHPLNPLSEIPTLSPLFVSPGSSEQIKWNLVNNYDALIKPVSYLAHHMGFAWVGGDRGQYVGDDMAVTRKDDGWQLKGYNGGSCSGYRCGDKTAITLTDFEYVMDTDSYRITGDVDVTDRELIQTVTAPAFNDTSVAQMTVVTISYDLGTNWSKSNDYSVSESVTLKNTWKSPAVTGGSDTELSVTIAANQAWGSSNGGSVSNNVSIQARVNIPPFTKLNAKVDLYSSSISYPYEFDADISYSLKNSGFMRWSGNGLLSHPENRPNDSSDFVIGRFAGEDKNIEYLWEHRYIPGVNKKWDWSWMIENTGLNDMKYWLSHVLRPKKTTLSGHFYAESEFAGSVYFGDEAPYHPTQRRTKRETQKPSEATYSRYESTKTQLKQQLEDAGLTNVKVDIKVLAPQANQHFTQY